MLLGFNHNILIKRTLNQYRFPNLINPKKMPQFLIYFIWTKQAIISKPNLTSKQIIALPLLLLLLLLCVFVFSCWGWLGCRRRERQQHLSLSPLRRLQNSTYTLHLQTSDIATCFLSAFLLLYTFKQLLFFYTIFIINMNWNCELMWL